MKSITPLFAAILVSAAGATSFAGDLDPPAGPIAPTMKPLDAIEPRVCINELPGSPTAVHVISEPGVYYCTGDVVGEAGKSAIVIDLASDSADDPVAIDLSGFTLRGAPGSSHGINLQDHGMARVERLQISGGAITGWGGAGLFCAGADDLTVADLVVTHNAGAGILADDVTWFRAGGDQVSNVIASNNGGTESFGGVVLDGAAYAIINGIEARNNNGAGLHIKEFSSLITATAIDYQLANISSTGNDFGGLVLEIAPNAPVSSVNIALENILASDNDLGVYIFMAGNAPFAIGSIDIALDQVVCSNNLSTGCEMMLDDDSTPFDLRVRDSAFDHNSSGFIFSGDQENDSAHRLDFERVSASSNSGDGFFLNASNTFPTAAKSVRMRHCSASANGGIGITASNFNEFDWNDVACHENDDAGGVLFSASAAPSAALSDCRFIGNGSNGVSVYFFREEPASNQDSIGNCRLDRVLASGNQGDGIVLTDIKSAEVLNAASSNNTGSGIRVQHFDSAVVDRSNALDNEGDGFTFENSKSGVTCGTVAINQSVSNGNVLHGFNLACSMDGSIRRCESSDNGGFGFLVAGAGHLVVENNAAGNTAGGYSIPIPGNAVGPIIDELGLATNTNPAANYVR